MNLTIALHYDLTPEWGGNRTDSKPTVFHMRMLTSPEREQFLKWEYSGVGVKLVPDRAGLVQTAVLGIDNLVVNGDSVKDAKTFLATPGLFGMFSEVAADIVAQNTRDEPKN